MKKDTTEKAVEESPEEEAPESAETEASEDAGDDSGGEGVRVPEQFQKDTHALISECNDTACLDYLSSCVSDKRQELMKAESNSTPDTYSTADMPKE